MNLKINFKFFQIQAGRVEKVDERNGVIRVVSCSLPEL